MPEPSFPCQRHNTPIVMAAGLHQARISVNLRQLASQPLREPAIVDAFRTAVRFHPQRTQVGQVFWESHDLLVAFRIAQKEGTQFSYSLRSPFPVARLVQSQVAHEPASNFVQRNDRAFGAEAQTLAVSHATWVRHTLVRLDAVTALASKEEIVINAGEF